MKHQKISQTTFSFIDTETTGLCPSLYGRVCEIAIIKVYPTGKRESFSQLINPNIPICKKSTAVHGITDDMVENQPPFINIAEKLISLLKNTALVFHNAAFDVPFLSYEFTNADFHFAPDMVLDTLQYARKHGNFKSNSLGNIANELGVCNRGWHRALADAHMTEEIFMHFLKKFKSVGIQTLAELEKLQKTKMTIFKTK